MSIERALEGIEQQEIRDRLQVRWNEILDVDDEKLFWGFRSKLLAKYEIADPLLVPSGISIAEMPLFLAHAWQQYAEEHDHQRVKLHLMLEFVELSIRFSVAVLISQIRVSHDDKLPEDLSAELAQLIRNPTLGQWLGILRKLSSVQLESPALPEMFKLYDQLDADTWLSNAETYSENESLLVLRNHVAHGGGFSNKKASEWVDAHKERVEGMNVAILKALGNTQFISVDNKLLLMGDKPSAIELEGFPEDASGCWMQVDGIPMPLWPLADYAPVSHFDKNGQLRAVEDSATAQIYASLNKKNLHFTPLGNDACVSQHADIEIFKKLFALNVDEGKKKQLSAYQWDNFIDDARDEAGHLVGRSNQITSLKNWVKGRDSRAEGVKAAAWVHGKPGMGKSMLIAKVVSDWASGANGEKDNNGLYYHRFRAGDGRNNLRMFMKLLQQALWAWMPLQKQTQEPDLQLEGDKLLEDIQQRLGFVEKMQARNEKATAPRYLLVVDGLDEVVSHEPKLMEALQSLLLPGVILLASSRDEQGLGEVMQELGAENLFPEGLPRLDELEIRAMLEKELTSAALLKTLAEFDLQDTPEDAISENKYVRNVLEHSEGLPLYIHLLVEDLKIGIRKLDDERLPDSLRDYYDEIMNRIGLSRVKRDLTDIIAVLAVTREPMERDALAQLLTDGDSDWQSYCSKVDAALSAGASLLRIAKSEDQGDGYVLYHQSYREYLLSGESPLEDLPDEMRKKKFLNLADKWDVLPDGNLKNHLFRQGTAYGIDAGGGYSEQAAERLCNFAYLMKRLKSLPASEVASLAEEYRSLNAHLPESLQLETHFIDWERFIQGYTHLLSDGDEVWPSNRILLQLAVEHADDSPITQAAEQWLEVDGSCDWLWVCSVERVQEYIPDPCLKVLGGCTTDSQGVHLLSGDRILSWGEDHTFRVWDLDNGECLSVLEGHIGAVGGVHLLEGDRALSWSNDETLRLWDLNSGKCLSVLEGHTGNIWGVHLLEGNRALSWSSDNNLRLWDLINGKCLSVLEGHTDIVWGMHLLEGERVLSWSSDNNLRLWDLISGKCLSVLEGHRDSASGVQVLDGVNSVLSWSYDGTLRLWDLINGECLSVLEGHIDNVWGAHLLDNDRVLSWSWDHTLRVWDLNSGGCLFVLEGHKYRINGVHLLNDDRALSWSNGETIRIWDLARGECLSVLEGHKGRVKGVHLLEGERALSWSWDRTLRIWDLNSGGCLFVLEGHLDPIDGVHLLDGNHALSWSNFGTLRLWDLSGVECLPMLEGHTEWVKGIHLLEGERALSWSYDGTLRVWDLSNGECLHILEGHTDNIWGVHLLDGSRALSWSSDKNLRLWDLISGKCLSVLEGHTEWVKGVHLLEGERALSWSDDSTLRAWDLERGKCLSVLEGHTEWVKGVHLLEGERALSWSYDGTLRVWDLSNGECLHILKGYRVVKGVHLLDGNRALSWSSDGTLRVWDLSSGVCLSVLEDHIYGIQGVHLLDSEHALSWDEHEALVWDLERGKCLSMLEGYSGCVDGFHLLEGDRVLSWSNGCSYRIWDLSNGKCIHVVETAAQEDQLKAELFQTKGSLWNQSNFLYRGNAIAAYYGDNLTQVRWHGNQASIKEFTEDGSWLVVNALKEVRVLQPWQGNQRLDLIPEHQDIPDAI